ncbi:hypothetical protein ABLE68_07375 [Nocardioides sp. CN2-186]|uniref:hypothetical protein n=1 Tax=Nocardioides tweenelious TaxID=3156607 RepID=UPI0032B3E97C
MIEYVATVTSPKVSDKDVVGATEIARAHGWTLVGATSRRGFGLRPARMVTELGA